MSAEAIVVDASLYEPIRVTEDKLESLLKTASASVFPGLSYFDFRPPIRCGESTRHPDGALLAPSLNEWWVVEVETHLHSVTDHIYPQLRDLSQGYYGPEAFRYLDRHKNFHCEEFAVCDVYNPSFLLVIDQLTPEVRQACSRTDFVPVECAPFLSSLQNRYALTVAGQRPRRDRPPVGAGLDMVLSDEGGVTALVPRDGKPVPTLPGSEIRIGDTILEGYVTLARKSMVVPLEPAEVRLKAAGQDRFRLVIQTMKLVGLDPPDQDITISL